jgi:hypothetical protein
MTKWTGYFKVVAPNPGQVKLSDSQEMNDVGAYNNYTWYQRLIQGSASRMTRYREYDLMDNDVEVARAVDSIAEEMTGNDPKSGDPIKIDLLTEEEKKTEGTEVLTIKAALQRWNRIHDWENRLFKVSRMVVKYGDVFFRKDPEAIHERWQFIHPKNVVAAVVHPNDVTKVIAWQLKKNPKKAKGSGYGMPLGAKQDTQYETEIVTAGEMVRFTLNDDMSDSSPFGESVLRSVYRSHKQKELLEDAIIIYRVQRAPERRVFYIDVGKMPPQRVKTYLENIKNEIKQKKIPNINGGQTEVDSVYNPQSMCLALDTKIPLLDGRSETLQTLIQEHEAGIQNWVYSIHPETGEYAPGMVSWAGVTRKNTETIKLTLDNGDEITCTPDHHFFVQGNGYNKVKAKDLTPTDSLWPFQTKIRKQDTNNSAKYQQVYNPEASMFERLEILGYTNFKHLVAESANFNHRVVKIEQGPMMDTGTLTIDKEHKYHDYHNFVIQTSKKNGELCGVVTANSEDFFFASRPEGRGSRVETLPGGAGLGELSDLEYFQRKVWRGLRVPASYMIEQQEGGQIWNDGKVGVAYIQELRFALFVSRLQGYIENTVDYEFKQYLKQANISIDPNLYKLILPEPSNFGKYKQQELDGQLLTQFSSADSVEYLSKRFILKRFLQLEDDEIIINERMKREELGLPTDADTEGDTDYKSVYGAGMEGGVDSFGGGMGGEELGPTTDGLGGATAGSGVGGGDNQVPI